VIVARGMLCPGEAVVHRHGVVWVVAGFVLSFSVALALTNSLGWHAPRLFGALCANVFSIARSVCAAM